MSRRFAGVGVAIPAARLQQIAEGSSADDDELTDVRFALAAMEFEHEQRLAKVKRNHRRASHWLIAAGLMLLLLSSLLCMALLFFSLTLHTYPR